MKKISALFVLVCALAVSFAQAGTVRLTGDLDGSGTGPNPAGGVLNVVIDLNAGDTLSAGGGIDFAVQTGTPDVIQFTSAQIVAGAWDVKNAAIQLSGQKVQLNTTALFAAGLPEGGQGQVLATINYSVLNNASSTALNYVLPAVAGIVDGTNAVDADVTANYTFVPGAITFGSNVPEPATLAMLGTGLIGLVLRRRNG